MKYRWKEIEADAQHSLYLLIDGAAYEVAIVEKRYPDMPWTAFVAGFVDAEKTPVEGDVQWDDVHDAKKEVLTYIKVWWVSGAFRRMSEDELEAWREKSAYDF